MSTPFSTPPMTVHSSSVSTIASHGFIPFPRNPASATPPNDSIEPTERSNPAVSSTKVLPIDTMNNTAIDRRMFVRLVLVRNDSCVSDRYTTITKSAMLTPRNRRVPR